MAKKHKHRKNPHDRVMSKLVNVRAKTGNLVDWQKVDETLANPFDLWGLIKRVINIAIGRKDEAKN